MIVAVEMIRWASDDKMYGLARARNMEYKRIIHVPGLWLAG